MAVKKAEVSKEPEIEIVGFEKITIPYRKVICKSCGKNYESSLIDIRENPSNLDRCYFKCEECGIVNNINRILTSYC